MATASRVTVTATAAKILDGGTKGASFLVRHLSGSTYYWGGSSGVTVSTGQPINVGEDFSVSLGAGDSIYMVCGTGQTASVSVGQVGGA